MWNSWVERDVIARIKENVNKHLSWFHLKIARNRNDRDRMENEELYTSLVYLEFEKLKNREILTYLDIYQNTDRINARIRSIKGITNLLALVSKDAKCQQQFLNSIKNVESFQFPTGECQLCQDKTTLHSSSGGFPGQNVLVKKHFL
jgi:hypothetical protein